MLVLFMLTVVLFVVLIVLVLFVVVFVVFMVAFMVAFMVTIVGLATVAVLVPSTKYTCTCVLFILHKLSQVLPLNSPMLMIGLLTLWEMVQIRVPLEI